MGTLGRAFCDRGFCLVLWGVARAGLGVWSCLRGMGSELGLGVFEFGEILHSEMEGFYASVARGFSLFSQGVAGIFGVLR